MKIIYLTVILVIPLILQPLAYSETYKDARGTVITQDQYDLRIQTCQEMINEDIVLKKEVGDCKSWVLTAIGREMIAYYTITK
jgi:hypothetical protein